MEKVKYLDTEEIKRFFDVIGSIRDRLIFSFLYHYGLRVGEACSLKLSDLNAQLIEIKIPRLKGGISRTYSISLQDAKLIKKWLKLRQEFPNADGNPYLFITKRSLSGPISQINVQKAHDRYSKLAGIDKSKSHPHVWRHSCAIKLLESGKDIFFIKSYLGHRSLQSSLVYLEIMPPEWAKLQRSVIETSFAV